MIYSVRLSRWIKFFFVLKNTRIVVNAIYLRIYNTFYSFISSMCYSHILYLRIAYIYKTCIDRRTYSRKTSRVWLVMRIHLLYIYVGCIRTNVVLSDGPYLAETQSVHPSYFAFFIRQVSRSKYIYIYKHTEDVIL